MNIQIVSWKEAANKTRIGKLEILYEGLLMKCELVVHFTSQRLWIRMPEVWLTPEKKVTYVYWIEKETSDRFQKEALTLLEKEFGINYTEASRIHKETMKQTISKKKVRQYQSK